jgi:hypothetical protein
VITISGKEYDLVPAKLRRWLELEDVKFRISEAVEDKDRNKLVNLIYLYLFTAIGIETNTMLDVPYREVLDAFNEIAKTNVITMELPFMRISSKREKLEDTGYEYDFRSWWSWANIFSTKYGWSLEYIAEMNVSDGLCLYQEYLIDKWHEREWEWMLSDHYSSYDEHTNTAKPNPYPKPEWMQPKIKEIKPTKIPIELLPIGAVVSWKDLNA